MTVTDTRRCWMGLPVSGSMVGEALAVQLVIVAVSPEVATLLSPGRITSCTEPALTVGFDGDTPGMPLAVDTIDAQLAADLHQIVARPWDSRYSATLSTPNPLAMAERST